MTAEPCPICGTEVCRLREATPVPPAAAVYALAPRSDAVLVPSAIPDADRFDQEIAYGCREVAAAVLIVVFVLVMAWLL